MSFDPTYPYRLDSLDKLPEIKNANFHDLLIEARAELGELKGYSFSMPNPLLLLSPAILKESVASSEIENINTTIIDVLRNQLLPEAERRQPDREVLRYHDAILWAFKNLNDLSLSTRLIIGIQRILMSSSKEGYRRAQNGIKNNITDEIVYMPPVASDIHRLMNDLENFTNTSTDELDPLIKSAIAHYQFEAIHPFEDGNGRTGRIIMVLSLIRYQVLNLPILYISGYLIKNRSQYYKLLMNVTKKGEWEEYIKFMLKGYTLQAKETKDILFKIMNLFFSFKDDLKKNHRKIYSADLVEAMFSFPVITPVKLAKELGIHYTTASRHLKELSKSGLLTESKAGRYHLFANAQLLKIIHK